MDWDENFVNAKYHLAVAERMMRSYGEVGDKRFLAGIIREAAKSVSFLIRAVMKDSRDDWKDVFLKCVGGETCGNLFKVLEIERAQKSSPIEYAKGDKIILLVNGKYRFLTAGRISEFVKSVGDGIKIFSESFRQI